jgi:hypothetical protein
MGWLNRLLRRDKFFISGSTRSSIVALSMIGYKVRAYEKITSSVQRWELIKPNAVDLAIIKTPFGTELYKEY